MKIFEKWGKRISKEYDKQINDRTSRGFKTLLLRLDCSCSVRFQANGTIHLQLWLSFCFIDFDFQHLRSWRPNFPFSEVFWFSCIFCLGFHQSSYTWWEYWLQLSSLSPKRRWFYPGVLTYQSPVLTKKLFSESIFAYFKGNSGVLSFLMF